MEQQPFPPHPDATPPGGYCAPYRFVLPHRMLTLASIVLLLASVALFGWLTWVLQGAPRSGTLPLLEFVLVVPLASVVLIVVHELIHGLVFRLFGYRVSYGVDWTLPGAYAATFGQDQTRRHLAVAAVAPLVLLNAISVPFLAAPQPAVVIAALTVLVTNTSGAVGDLYVVYRVLRLPRGTLLRDLDPRTMLIFEPDRLAA